MLPVRLLPDLHTDGPRQMATDEVMLARAEQGVASLRFYTWSEATISLGYFQSSGTRLQDKHWESLPFVRRATGGGAIVHHHELTYSFALPLEPAWQPRHVNWIAQFHQVISTALQSLGVPIRSQSCEVERGKGEFLCFLHQTPCDVLLGDAKVVGSAQRRRRGLMQHGSILLGQSEFTPQLPGILEQSGRRLDPVELKQAITDSLAEMVNWDLRSDVWTQAEREEIDRLAREKYASAVWNERR